MFQTLITLTLCVVDRVLVGPVHPAMVLEHVPLAGKPSSVSRAGDKRAPIRIRGQALAPVDFAGVPLQTGAVAEGLYGAVAHRTGKGAGMFGHVAPEDLLVRLSGVGVGKVGGIMKQSTTEKS